MKNVNVNGQRYMAIKYQNYIANNLGEFGCAIFDSEDYPNFDFDNLLKYLRLHDSALDKVYLFPLNVYSSQSKRLHVYHVFANSGHIPPFNFFDSLRLACGTFKLNAFYACDFQTAKIYQMTPFSVCKYDELYQLKKLLNLDENNFIVVKLQKWFSPPSYINYLQRARVFRNETEKEFFDQYGKYYAQYGDQKLETDQFYSMEECKNNFNKQENCLEFDNRTILEFDINDPTLSIYATNLKAQNLNVKNLFCDELFCGDLRCDFVKGDKIYAESIVCKNISASLLKTNFNFGVKFLNK